MRHSVVLVAVVALACMATAQADDVFSRAYHGMQRDFARNNHWPEPFCYPDRDAVVQPFAVMIAKGWQVQNTLSDHHFQADQSRLAASGEHRVYQILSDPVAQRRMIFVQQGRTPQETMTRIAAVRMSTAKMLPPGMDVAVYPSGIQHRAWLGTEQLGVMAGYEKGRRSPTLSTSKAE